MGNNCCSSRRGIQDETMSHNAEFDWILNNLEKKRDQRTKVYEQEVNKPPPMEEDGGESEEENEETKKGPDANDAEAIAEKEKEDEEEWESDSDGS